MGFKDLGKLFKYIFQGLCFKRKSFGVFSSLVAIMELPFLIPIALLGGIYFED